MQRFWPLYREYRVEASKVGDRIVALITTYADNYENLTDKARINSSRSSCTSKRSAPA